MTKLNDKQLGELREKWLNKKVNLLDEAGNKHVGVVDFIGYNRMLPSWGFQVTLSRTPVQHVIVDSIKLASDRREV